jgi:hypothetical protein
MSKPAAAEGDLVTGIDHHRFHGELIAVPFLGYLVEDLANTVLIQNAPAARIASIAVAKPKHIAPGGGEFDFPPVNRGVVIAANGNNVLVENWPLARDGDPVETCTEILEIGGVVMSRSTVLVG